MTYDYLIVGAGLSGATLANLLAKKGRSVLIIDKRNEVAGNCATHFINDILVHDYGPHIFHTDNKEVWNFVNKYCEMIPYVNTPKASYNGKLYSLPFNMNTFYELWGAKTWKEAEKIFEEQIVINHNPKNLEEKALSMVGKDIYEMFIKNYTEKQWGKPCNELPPDIITRLPLRKIFNNNYYNNIYQGIPKEGYTDMILKMLHDPFITVLKNINVNKNWLDNNKDLAEKIIFTGSLDNFFNYKFGRLNYRSINFVTKIVEQDDVNSNAVINYTDKSVDYTRVTEYKHFFNTISNISVLSYEYPYQCTELDEPMYPMDSIKLHDKYQKEFKKLYPNSELFGRLATYKYLDMDKVVEQSINYVKRPGV